MSGQSFFEETEEIGLGKDFGRWSTPCPLSTLLNHSVTHQDTDYPTHTSGPPGSTSYRPARPAEDHCEVKGNICAPFFF
eukprot:1325791-Amorphochlora_amoeboformis.AAC.1